MIELWNRIKEAIFPEPLYGLVSLDVESPRGTGQMITSKNPPVVFACTDSDEPGPRLTNCPSELHDWPLPSGYNDAIRVANRRLRTGWKNRQCECGLYGWVPGPDARIEDRVTLQGRMKDPSDYYSI